MIDKYYQSTLMVNAMNLRFLNYFLAVKETGHFGLAAEKCFVSQPTLSSGIQKLEQELDLLLIDRDNRSVGLTPAGEEIAQMAKSIVTQIETMKDYARYKSDPFAGTLRLGAIPTIAPYLLPLVMKSLKSGLPKIEWQLFEYQTEGLLKHLVDGDIDVAILATEESNKHFVQIPLLDEIFQLVMPKGHSLKTKKSLKSSDVENAHMLLLAEGHCLRDQALDVCSSRNIHADNDFKATSLETLRQMVVAGAGVTLMPALSVKEKHQRTGLDIRELPKPQPKRTIYLTWRRNFYRLPLLGKVAEILQSRVEELGL